jgi:hypothetical protein
VGADAALLKPKRPSGIGHNDALRWLANRFVGSVCVVVSGRCEIGRLRAQVHDRLDD